MMAAMTDAMGGELDRQIEQIDGKGGYHAPSLPFPSPNTFDLTVTEIGKYADKTTEKAHGLTYRTNRMIK